MKAVGRKSRRLTWFCCVAIGVTLFAHTGLAHGQSGSDSPQIDRKIVFLPEQVVVEQWPVMRNFVHVPADMKQIEPGQCIRFAVTASGTGSDKLLQNAKFNFEFTVLGKTESFAMEPVQAFKETTLITHETVAKSLQSVEAAKALLLARYMAASKAGWCAPVDVQDGTLTVKGSAITSDGKTISLERRNIEVKTFETARKHPPFKSLEMLGQWTMQYHATPDPAQLLLALRMIAGDQKMREELGAWSFFVAALQASKPAAEELMRRLPSEDRLVRLYSVSALKQGGYSTESLVSGFTEQDKSLLQSLQFPDPYDMTPGPDIGARQDMLWSIFFATGSIKPVRAIASELAWGDDYARFKKAADAGERTGWSDSVGRAVGYSAAGWSMGSLAQEDNLVYDYIDVLKASSDTPPAIKKELENLYKNPAFRGPGAR